MELKKTERGHMGMVKIGSAEDIATAVYEIVHHAMERVPGHDGLGCCEMAGGAGMGAALNLALTICKKPEGLNVGRIEKEDAVPIYQSLRTETLVFAGLLIAHQFDGVVEHDADHMGLRAKFGPIIFGMALAQWQKIYPDLDIADYLEPPVVAMAKHELNNPENHFNVQKDFDHRFLLRNNGSIN